ncbi:hypothetical protein BLNAU_20099 [Blattamonas nauphoetae]|uniref:Uncharacterized protein n=1 Tax=Blattamonas nauphoetae TaxID=2049346 RepID=A0ABQ9X2X4_9EUKA|nr:hypothetical protein BLNAU_20099 [Blattamonas nauphoetae]
MTEAILSRIRSRFLTIKCNWGFVFARSLLNFSSDNLKLDDLSSLLFRFSFGITVAEESQLFDSIKEGSTCTKTALMLLFFPELSESRFDVVEGCWADLSRGKQALSIDYLRDRFRPELSLSVVQGRRKADYETRDFENAFDSKLVPEPLDALTFTSFELVSRILSAGMSDDAEFGAQMVAVWDVKQSPSTFSSPKKTPQRKEAQQAPVQEEQPHPDIFNPPTEAEQPTVNDQIEEQIAESIATPIAPRKAEEQPAASEVQETSPPTISLNDLPTEDTTPHLSRTLHPRNPPQQTSTPQRPTTASAASRQRNEYTPKVHFAIPVTPYSPMKTKFERKNVEPIRDKLFVEINKKGIDGIFGMWESFLIESENEWRRRKEEQDKEDKENGVEPEEPSPEDFYETEPYYLTGRLQYVLNEGFEIRNFEKALLDCELLFPESANSLNEPTRNRYGPQNSGNRITTSELRTLFNHLHTNSKSKEKQLNQNTATRSPLRRKTYTSYNEPLLVKPMEFINFLLPPFSEDRLSISQQTWEDLVATCIDVIYSAHPNLEFKSVEEIEALPLWIIHTLFASHLHPLVQKQEKRDEEVISDLEAQLRPEWVSTIQQLAQSSSDKKKMEKTKEEREQEVEEGKIEGEWVKKEDWIQFAKWVSFGIQDDSYFMSLMESFVIPAPNITLPLTKIEMDYFLTNPVPTQSAPRSPKSSQPPQQPITPTKPQPPPTSPQNAPRSPKSVPVEDAERPLKQLSFLTQKLKRTNTSLTFVSVYSSLVGAGEVLTGDQVIDAVSKERVRLTDDEKDTIRSIFDGGDLNAEEAVELITPALNKTRAAMVESLFERLADGGLTKDRLESQISVRDIDDVKDGTISAHSFLSMFFTAFLPSGALTKESLQLYYTLVSPSIDSDSEFGRKMWSGWKLARNPNSRF